ncbi:MAG: hypothetical protein R3C39_13210 [Dehalococcoidia bacterium]
MSASDTRRRHGPRGPCPLPPLPVDAFWDEGPRTEAWNELWRRLLEVVLADGGDGDAPADSPGSDADDECLAADQWSGEVQR